MKNFIFDLYNTLIDICTDEHREQSWLPVVDFFAERSIRSDASTLIKLYDECWSKHLDELYKKSEYRYPEGDIVCVYRLMASALGGKLSDEDAARCAVIARRASHVWLRIFDGVFELFTELRRCGGRVYLLSNAQSVFTRDEIALVGLTEDKFDGVMLSSDYGCRKPDVAYFSKLFEKFELKKSESVMIGDDPETDGKGAAEFGIEFVYAKGGAPECARRLTEMAAERK